MILSAMALVIPKWCDIEFAFESLLSVSSRAALSASTHVERIPLIQFLVFLWVPWSAFLGLDNFGSRGGSIACSE